MAPTQQYTVSPFNQPREGLNDFGDYVITKKVADDLYLALNMTEHKTYVSKVSIAIILIYVHSFFLLIPKCLLAVYL